MVRKTVSIFALEANANRRDYKQLAKRVPSNSPKESQNLSNVLSNVARQIKMQHSEHHKRCSEVLQLAHLYLRSISNVQHSRGRVVNDLTL